MDGSFKLNQFAVVTPVPELIEAFISNSILKNTRSEGH